MLPQLLPNALICPVKDKFPVKGKFPVGCKFPVKGKFPVGCTQLQVSSTRVRVQYSLRERGIHAPKFYPLFTAFHMHFKSPAWGQDKSSALTFLFERGRKGSVLNSQMLWSPSPLWVVLGPTQGQASHLDWEDGGVVSRVLNKL